MAFYSDLSHSKMVIFHCYMLNYQRVCEFICSWPLFFLKGVSSPKAYETSKIHPHLTFIFSGEVVRPASMHALYIRSIPMFAVWFFSLIPRSIRPWGGTVTKQHFRKVGPMDLQALAHGLRLNQVASHHSVHMGCVYVYIC